LHSGLLWKPQLVYAHETLCLPVLQAQRHQLVVLKGCDENQLSITQTFDVQSLSDKNLVTSSWLTAPCTICGKPVVVPKLLRK
jgi:hypothetical protein